MLIPKSPADLGLPYDSWWPGQREVLEEIVASDKRIVLLRARTGFGKSLISQALAVIGDPASDLSNVLVMTHTHNLQEQYKSSGFTSVKGRSNFFCPDAGGYPPPDWEGCNPKVICKPSLCEYARQRFEGEIANLTVTNYAFALRVLRKDNGFGNRAWGVCDEGQHLLGCIEDVWIDEEKKRVEKWRKQLLEDGHYDEALQLKPRNPPLWPSREFVPRVLPYFSRVLVMSATLPGLRVWSKLYGVPESDILYIEAPDNWPNNSPLYVWPVVKLNRDSMPSDYDKLAEGIKTIMAEYPDRKGLIHPHSYKLMKNLYERLDSDRIIWGMGGHRAAAIKEFLSGRRQPNSILCATAINEGFNLPYELGFQIVVKVPYPDLGDVMVKARAKDVPEWYAQETIDSISQAWGRVVRAPDDSGDTFITDGNVLRLIKTYPDLWPSWIRRQTAIWASD